MVFLVVDLSCLDEQLCEFYFSLAVVQVKANRPALSNQNAGDTLPASQTPVKAGPVEEKPANEKPAAKKQEKKVKAKSEYETRLCLIGLTLRPIGLF